MCLETRQILKLKVAHTVFLFQDPSWFYLALLHLQRPGQQPYMLYDVWVLRICLQVPPEDQSNESQYTKHLHLKI